MTEFSGMFGMPPEIMQQIQEQARYHHELVSDEMHQINEFFDRLSVDDKRMLAHIFQDHCADPRQTAVWATTLLMKRAVELNICQACGKNHDENFNQELSQVLPDLKVDPTWLGDKVQDVAEPEPIVTSFDKTVYLEVCKEYGVMPVNPETATERSTVICTNIVNNKVCGHTWVNLADRIIAEPGSKGCPNCINMTKWG